MIGRVTTRNADGVLRALHIRNHKRLPLGYLGRLLGDSSAAGPHAVKLLNAARWGDLKTEAKGQPDLDSFVSQQSLLAYLSKHEKPSELKDCLVYQWALLCTGDVPANAYDWH